MALSVTWISESSLRNWEKQAEIDEGRGPEGALTSEEKKELQQLRREIRTADGARLPKRSRSLLRQ